MTDEILILILTSTNLILIGSIFFYKKKDLNIINVLSMIEAIQYAANNLSINSSEDEQEFFEGMHDGTELIRSYLVGDKRNMKGRGENIHLHNM